MNFLQVVRNALASAISAAGLATAPAMAQTPVPATVTHVVDGDTVDAQLPDGNVVRVRLIGVDAPERGECGTSERPNTWSRSRSISKSRWSLIRRSRSRCLWALALLRGPNRRRRPRAADASGGVGRRVFVYDQAPQRNPYVHAEVAAPGGVWRLCDGEVHRHADEQPSDADRRRATAVAIRRYYRRFSNHQYRSAWRMLGARRRAQVRSWEYLNRPATTLIVVSVKVFDGPPMSAPQGANQALTDNPRAPTALEALGASDLRHHPPMDPVDPTSPRSRGPPCSRARHSLDVLTRHRSPTHRANLRRDCVGTRCEGVRIGAKAALCGAVFAAVRRYSRSCR